MTKHKKKSKSFGYCYGGKVKMADGGQIGSTIGGLAGTGLSLIPGVGPVVAGIAAPLLGALGGAIGGSFDHKSNILSSHISPVTNINPFGTEQYKKGGWIQKAINPAHKGWCTPLSNPHCTGHRRALALRFKHGLEDGGSVDNIQIDIEKGEGLVQPNKKGDFDILSDFSNPNRYKAHANTADKENPGNFVEAPQGSIVINKPNWDKFKAGDKIMRNSIVKDILAKQLERANNGEIKKKRGGIVYDLGGGVPGGNPLEDYFLNLIKSQQPDNSYTAPDLGFLAQPVGGILSDISQTTANPIIPTNKTTNGSDTLNYPEAILHNQFDNTNLSNPYKQNARDKQFVEPTTPNVTKSAFDPKSLVTYIGDFAQLIDSAGKDKINLVQDNNNAESYLQQLPTNFDISGALNQNNRDLYAANNTVNQYRNPASNAANRSQLFANKLNADNALYETKINTENQLKGNKLGALAENASRLGQENTAYKASYFDQLLRQKAAQSLIRNSALSNIGEPYQKQQNNNADLNILTQIGKYFSIDAKGNLTWKGGNLTDYVNFPTQTAQ